MEHVILAIEVEAGKGEADAWASEVDGEAVGASLAVERTTSSQGVVGRGANTRRKEEWNRRRTKPTKAIQCC
jgi:hypothetical protein